MTDEVWKREEVQSPCVKLCTIHPQAQLCVGCLRSLDEIAAWSALSNDQRAQIVDDLPARKPLLRQRRGGRSQRLKRA